MIWAASSRESEVLVWRRQERQRWIVTMASVAVMQMKALQRLTPGRALSDALEHSHSLASYSVDPRYEQRADRVVGLVKVWREAESGVTGPCSYSRSTKLASRRSG